LKEQKFVSIKKDEDESNESIVDYNYMNRFEEFIQLLLCDWNWWVREGVESREETDRVNLCDERDVESIVKK
jgi:hypothetical protein